VGDGRTRARPAPFRLGRPRPPGRPSASVNDSARPVRYGCGWKTIALISVAPVDADARGRPARSAKGPQFAFARTSGLTALVGLGGPGHRAGVPRQGLPRLLRLYIGLARRRPLGRRHRRAAPVA
jgi:hypothetical protein